MRLVKGNVGYTLAKVICDLISIGRPFRFSAPSTPDGYHLMAYLLFVSIANLFLGMGLAAMLQRRGPTESPVQSDKLESLTSVEWDVAVDPRLGGIKLCTKQIPELNRASATVELSRQKVPSAWLELLDVESFNDELEPAWCMVQTLSRRLNDRLFAVGLKLVQGLQQPAEAQVTGIHQQLTEVTHLLNQRQKELQSFLEHNQINLQAPHASAKRLVQLSERLNQVAPEELGHLVQLQPTAGAREKVLRALQDIQYRLAATLYLMRDQSQLVLGEMAISLDDAATQEGQHAVRDPADPETSWDLCRVFARWQEDESSSGRPLCLGLVDINQVEQFNRDYETGFVDRILAGFGRQLAKVVKSKGGFSRVFRLSGQTFAVLLGDMNGQAGILVMDRLRYDIAQATFVLDEVQLKATVNTATIEVDRHEPLLDSLARAEETLKHGKSLGPNQNALMLDKNLTVVEPQRYEASEAMIQL
jgi:GGDEF domain-containing protein